MKPKKNVVKGYGIVENGQPVCDIYNASSGGWCGSFWTRKRAAQEVAKEIDWEGDGSYKVVPATLSYSLKK